LTEIELQDHNMTSVPERHFNRFAKIHPTWAELMSAQVSDATIRYLFTQRVSSALTIRSGQTQGLRKSRRRPFLAFFGPEELASSRAAPNLWTRQRTNLKQAPRKRSGDEIRTAIVTKTNDAN
jgi:hypothetical protein